MKIAYVLHWNMFRNDGVVRKMNTQIRLWQPSVDVRVFALSPPGPDGAPMPPQTTVFPFRSMFQRLRAMRALVRAVNAWKPDAIYYRYDPPYPPLVQLFDRLPTVVEINTDDVKEFGLGSRLRHYYNLLTRGAVFSRARGIVSVTRELTRNPIIARFGKPCLVVANGIDTADFRELPPAQAARPRLAFIGSAKVPWHGVDKIVAFARQAPELDFDLIGENLVDPGTIPSNVRVHGYLPRSAYEPILAAADVGLGALALHRVSIGEACSLKVREYLAYGLPVILGCPDTDFPGGADYLLELPNCDENVSAGIDAIRQFVAKMKGRRVPRADAVPRIDARIKEQQRLAFIEERSRPGARPQRS